MTQEIRDRYESALEKLRSVVTRTGDARDRIQALIRDTASKLYDALERDPSADTEEIIEDFQDQVEGIALENMRSAAREAQDEEDEDSADVALTLTLSRVDLATPVHRYATALSQEVKWFVAGGFAYGALREYMKDPMGFLAAESMKPAQKGKATKQSEGRMTLAPVFMDGKRRRSLSEVLADFRHSITAVVSGNSYQVGKSVWMFLNVTSMEAYNDALAMKWAGKGAVGYYVFRASNYDCPLCDEQCGFLHPLTDMVVPIHPHCVCVTIEAYSGEAEGGFEL